MREGGTEKVLSGQESVSHRQNQVAAKSRISLQAKALSGHLSLATRVLGPRAVLALWREVASPEKMVQPMRSFLS